MNYKCTYLTLFQYSPRGNSLNSIKSRGIKDSIKAGRVQLIQNVVSYINKLETEESGIYNEYFGSDVTLVPMPGSGLFLEGAIRPPLIISQCILNDAHAGVICDVIRRSKPVRKSSNYYTSDTRPLIHEHLASITVNPDLSVTKRILLIDDVLTLGRTALACKTILEKAYPDADIKSLALLRTSLSEIDSLYHPENGEIIGYMSGKSFVEKASD